MTEDEMSDPDFTPDAVRAALRDADRHIRLNYLIIAALGGLQAFIAAWALRVLDFADPVHRLIVLGAAFVCVQMLLLAEILQSRQNAVNARMLRALELLDERLAGR
jgi:heme A synthase